MRILLAEDNEMNQQLAVRILNKRGHEVAVADNGKDAVHMALDGPDVYDVVLMDVHLPGLGGFDATAAIREGELGRDRTTPIIALTAHAGVGIEARCLSAGMDAYVAKPINVSELIDAIDRVVALHRQAPQPDTARGGETNGTSTAAASSSVDWSAAVQQLGGDEELLLELAALFVEGGEALRADVSRAAEEQDAEALRSAAHRLSATLGQFKAHAAHATAQRLEKLGAAGKMGQAVAIAAQLEQEVRAVRLELVERVPGAQR